MSKKVAKQVAAALKRAAAEKAQINEQIRQGKPLSELKHIHFVPLRDVHPDPHK